MRALVVGAGGQLGQALVRLLGEQLARAVTHAELDVRDREAVARVVALDHPDVILNASAYNQVDAAETEPAQAFAVNALGPCHLARAARESGALLVHVSTDYVFDGLSTTPYAEDDLPRPRSVYGASKLAGEHLAATAPGLVVRTSAVYGAGGSRSKGGSFVERVLARALAGQPLRVVTDQVFSPTYAPDLAAGILALLERGARGRFHVTNAGECSWHELASAALAAAGVRAEIARIRAADLAQPAARPPYSVLANARYRALGLPPLRPWQQALDAFLQHATASPG